ncbi:hypothetical protein JW756_01280 [Candidatus Woesearchaeota archaeon]|nr:hypothetical protein [Candidatus Woesearchaeota archaeon]
MGSWSKGIFGKEYIGRTGIIVAGTISPYYEKNILKMFEKVLDKKDQVYHAYVVKKGKNIHPLVFNVLGAPAAIDCVSILHDGGCRNLVFVGFAYGFKNKVGDAVVPNKSYHFDGIYHALKIDKDFSLPDYELNEKLKQILRKEKNDFFEGINISVPSVTLQPKHKNKDYERIKPTTLEMEYAAFLSWTREIGIRSAGVMIISDTKNDSIGDEGRRKIRREKRESVIASIVKNISDFDLKPLKNSEKFSLDQCLAEIVEIDDKTLSIYRRNDKKLKS